MRTEMRTSHNPHIGNGLYGDIRQRGRTDAFGVLELDGDRYLVPESWAWAIKMTKGQRRPKTIPANLPPSARVLGKATMSKIRRRMRELGEGQPRDALGRFTKRTNG